MVRKVAPYILIMLVGIYMFRGIFAPGFMSGYDSSFHYYDVYYLSNVLIPQYHWIGGWNMQLMAGMPVFIDYSQLPFLVIVLLHKIFSVSLSLSYKMMVLFTYIFVGAAFHKLSSLRFGRIPSLIMAVCLMLQVNIYRDRILNGMWNEFVGAALLCIFFHYLDKYIDNLSAKRAAALGMILAALILSYLVIAALAFFLLFVYFFPMFSKAYKEKNVARMLFIYGFIPLVAFGISTYYLYGFLASPRFFCSFSYKDLATGIVWSIKSFFGPIEVVGSKLASFNINLPVLIRVIFGFFGLYVFIRYERDGKMRRFLWCTLAFVFVALVLLSDILLNLCSWWRVIPFVQTLYTNRFTSYIHIGMYVFAAYGIMKLTGRFKIAPRMLVVLLIPILLSAHYHYRYFAREASQTLDSSPQMDNVWKVLQWVNENVDWKTERVVYQNTTGNIEDPILSRSDVFALSGIFTKVQQIGVSRCPSPFPHVQYLLFHSGLIFSRRDVDAGYIRGMMDIYNAGYIVSVEPVLKKILEQSILFSKKREFGSFAIFQSVNHVSGWVSFKKSAEYKLLELDNQDLRFKILNKADDNELDLKFGYYPFWKAKLDGKPIKVGQGDYGLMKINIPERGEQVLVLSYKCKNYLWLIVSLISIIMAVSVFLSNRKKDLV